MGSQKTGTEFWRDAVQSYGLDEAIVIAEQQLSTYGKTPIRSEDNQFCRELFAAMYEATAGKTAPSKLVYPYSLDEADVRGELDTYHASRRLNTECAAGIDDAINNSCYESGYYNLESAVREAVQEYGFERVNYVLTANIISRMDDGRFSTANKDWAWLHGADKPEQVSHYAFINAHPTRLDSFTQKVRNLYRELQADRFRLPGQRQSGHEVGGYEILRSIQFDNNQGFALGYNPEVAQTHATWLYKFENGCRVFSEGDYFEEILSAQDSYVARVAVYMRDERVEERTSPIAAEEMDTEQNYSMIDGVRNNISPEEPPSVREQLLRAQQEPKPTSTPRPDRERDELER